MNFFFWEKKESENDPAFAPYEEINSKKTSKLGYFFLILMVIFGVAQGNGFLSALQDSITEPERNSTCLSTLAEYANLSENGNNSGYGYYRNTNNGCVFSTRETNLGLDIAYKSIEPTLIQISTLEKTISNLNAQIRDVENNKKQTVDNYEVSLVEGIANTQDKIFNQGALQAGYVTQEEKLKSLRSSLSQETTLKRKLADEIVRLALAQKATIERARSEYRSDMSMYEFKQFLLSLLFIVPLFLFVWHRYFVSKSKRSEYAIIWGGMVATTGLMLAQVLLVFVYQILPKEILQQIFNLLAQIKIIWALLYWLGFILVPLFFGFLIYIIQKKFYNKRAVMMRALKNQHCPYCSLKINPSMNNCPVCGYTLKTKCLTCGGMSMSGGSFCEVCGARDAEA
ncbi:MAG: zinc ribbon domain-containing protein [Candidatus Pacebacteria bacterium]|nr:zinc ribbon domain-containing protein [Candidatus Paceibacterota bacterium]MCF7857431.1 zinc ribbon domain-containing protein [Candidatus Paceibacterota bacterium]